MFDYRRSIRTRIPIHQLRHPDQRRAIRSIKLIVGAIADTAEEGMRIPQVEGMAETGRVTARIWRTWSSTLGRASWLSSRASTKKTLSP